MRVAYADPPYPGQSHLYRKHADYAGEVDHAVLIARLEDEFSDGWALSTSVPALGYVLSLCPTPEKASEFRVCVWRRQPVPRPPARVMWSWEPVIVRTPSWRQRHRDDFVADTLSAQHRPGFQTGEITGQKPPAFCRWVFDLLGMNAADDFVDLFPGSGAVTREWERWRAQGSIFDLSPASARPDCSTVGRAPEPAAGGTDGGNQT